MKMIGLTKISLQPMFTNRNLSLLNNQGLKELDLELA
jgi:hypothetical protein